MNSFGIEHLLTTSGECIKGQVTTITSLETELSDLKKHERVLTASKSESDHLVAIQQDTIDKLIVQTEADKQKKILGFDECLSKEYRLVIARYERKYRE